MSVRNAWNGLRWKLAKLSAENSARMRFTPDDWKRADEMIDNMNHTDLLRRLAEAEDEASA